MNRSLIRVVSLLLIPCLLLDAGTAHAFTTAWTQPAPLRASADLTSEFAQQALTLRVIETIKPFVGRLIGVRKLQSRLALAQEARPSSPIVRELPASYKPVEYHQAHRNESVKDSIVRGAGITWMYTLAPIVHTLLSLALTHQLPDLNTYVWYAAAGMMSYLAGRQAMEFGALRLSALRGPFAGLFLAAIPFALQTMIGHASYNFVASHIGLPLLTLPEEPTLPVQPSKEADQALQRAMDGRRTLIFSDSADAIDATLLQKARQQHRSYLRVTLRNQEDLDRLNTRVFANYPKVEKQPGDLRQIIRAGGILLIDYNKSDPKLVESLNSLFDAKPYFGAETASPDLTIIGVMKDAQLEQHPVSFYSRFHRIDSVEVPFDDPIEHIPMVHPDYPPLNDSQSIGYKGSADPALPPEHDAGGSAQRAHAIEVQLFHGPFFREAFLSKLKAISGKIVWPEHNAALLSAIQGPPSRYEKRNLPLIIHGADWNDPAFTDFIRQILLTRQFEVNGKTYTLPPDFKIYRADTDFAKDINDKKILAPGESESPDQLWIINRANQDILLERNAIRPDGRLDSSAGILSHDSKIPLRIRITGHLDDWVWNMIMHNESPTDVEVLPGVYIPKEYRSLRSEKLKQGVLQQRVEPLEEAAKNKSLLLETNDPAFARQRIEQIFEGRHLLYYPVTPSTTLSDLIGSLEVTRSADEGMHFHMDRKSVLESLRQGDVVVLENLESNEDLARQLETALSESPYLHHHNEGGNLQEMPGQLVVVGRTAAGLKIDAVHRVRIDTDDAAIEAVLAREFPERFKAQDYKRLMHLRDVLKAIPAPPQPGLYPELVDLSLNRLRLLYRYPNWVEAFENVIVSQYADAPNVAAFIRTMVRLTFEEEETGRKTHTLHGHKLSRALNKLVPDVPVTRHFWEMADALSLDLLQQARLGDDFTHPHMDVAQRIIREALIKNAASEEEKGFHRYRFHISEDVSHAANIDRATRVGEPTWQEQKEKVIRALDRTPAVMLKGSPGTGKSYITDEIGRELGYRNGEVVGPITVGSDVEESDVLTRRVFEEGQTKSMDEAVARWARLPEGGLLVVDEANLTDPAFWNFLRGLFSEPPHVWINGHRQALTPRHRVIFTGNQESLAGRQFQQLIQDFMVTVPFAPFDETFLKQRLNEYVASTKTRRDALVDLMLDLHHLFQTMGPDIGFSLRDVQELSARVNVFLGSDWKPQDVVGIAWELYSGNFNTEERGALEHLIAQKYGVEIPTLTDHRVAKIREQQPVFVNHSDDTGNIVLVPSTAQMVGSIEDFLAMRKARIAAGTRLQGKRGMIFEGASGRGKDAVLVRTLQNEGYVDAKDPDAAKVPAAQRYYHLNASLDYDEMVRTIRQAQKEGSIVIVSEMNLLPSALIEGKLNDVLTGNAVEGFAFFATMNTTDFSGREKLSTALLNRVVYQRMADYSEKELEQIVQEWPSGKLAEKTLSTEDLLYAVKAHVWIRDQIANTSLHPTLRDLLHAVKLKTLIGEPMEAVLEGIYGPLYLQRVLKGAALPSRKELLAYQEKNRIDNVKMIELLAGFIVPSDQPLTLKLHGGGKDKAPAFYTSTDNSITLRSDAFSSGQWEELTYHEASHGRFTRRMYGLTPNSWEILDPLDQDLEDLRHLNAFTHHFPASEMNVPSSAEQRFAAIVTESNLGDLSDWMNASEQPLSLQQVFQYTLVTYAKSLVTEEEIDGFATLLAEVLPVNPVALASLHLQAALEIAQAIPQILEEEEIQFQQYRALRRLQTMRTDYASIPELNQEKETPSVEEQSKAVESAAEELRNAILRAQAVKEEESIKSQKGALSKKDIQKQKAALKASLDKQHAQMKRDVEKELDLITADLTSEAGVTPERLDEMLAILTKEEDPSQVVLKARQLKDRALNQRLKTLRSAVQSRLHETDGEDYRSFLKGLPLGELRSMLGKLGGLFGGLEMGGSGHGSRHSFGEPIGPRRRMGGAAGHDADMTSGVHAVALSAPKVVRAEVALHTEETAPRDAELEKVSGTYSRELDNALSDFVSRKLQADKVYGSEGTLDVERFVTGDPTTAFRRSGGKLEETRKEIVLYNEWHHAASMVDSPFLTEVPQYLFSQGFKVTLYTSPHSYIQGISTLSDLRAYRNNPGWSDVSREIIEKDLQSRKSKNEYELTTLEDLQKRVEAIYLYGAFKNVLNNEKKGSEHLTGVSKEAESSRWSIAEQQKWLELRYPGVDIRPLDSGDFVASFSKSPSVGMDLVDWPPLDNLAAIEITDARVPDLKPLLRQKQLCFIQLSGSAWRGTEDEIYNLLAEHENFVQIEVVRGSKYEEYELSQVPGSYWDRNPPSYRAQVKLAQILLKRLHLDPQQVLFRNDKEQRFGLDLRNYRPTNGDSDRIGDALQRFVNLNQLMLRSLFLESPVFGHLRNLELLFTPTLRSIITFDAMPALKVLGVMPTEVEHARRVVANPRHPVEVVPEEEAVRQFEKYFDQSSGGQKTPAPTAERELTFHQQVDQAQMLLVKSGLEPWSSIRVDREEELFAIDLSKTNLTDLSEVAQWTRLAQLNLGDLDVDIEPLESLPNLTWINTYVSFRPERAEALSRMRHLTVVGLDGESGTTFSSAERILHAKHPLKDRLKVLDSGKALDSFGNFGSPKRELTFHEQLDAARQLLKDVGLPEDRLTWDEGTKLFALDLAGAKLPFGIGRVLQSFTRLAHLRSELTFDWFPGLHLPELRILICHPPKTGSDAQFHAKIPKLEILELDSKSTDAELWVKKHYPTGTSILVQHGEAMPHFGFGKKEELTFEQQLKISRDILRLLGLPEDRLSFDQRLKLIALDLKLNQSDPPGSIPIILAHEELEKLSRLAQLRVSWNIDGLHLASWPEMRLFIGVGPYNPKHMEALPGLPKLGILYITPVTSQKDSSVDDWLRRTHPAPTRILLPKTPEIAMQHFGFTQGGAKNKAADDLNYQEQKAAVEKLLLESGIPKASHSWYANFSDAKETIVSLDLGDNFDAGTVSAILPKLSRLRRLQINYQNPIKTPIPPLPENIENLVFEPPAGSDLVDYHSLPRDMVWKSLPQLQSVELVHGVLPELSFLLDIPSLHKVLLRNIDIPQDKITEFIQKHPNPDIEVRVVSYAGSADNTWSKQRLPTPSRSTSHEPTDVDQQRTLIEDFLADRGLQADVIHTDEKGEISLGLHDPKFDETGLAALSKLGLTKLAKINLEGTSVTSIGIFEFLAEHPDSAIVVRFNGEDYDFSKIPQGILDRRAEDIVLRDQHAAAETLLKRQNIQQFTISEVVGQLGLNIKDPLYDDADLRALSALGISKLTVLILIGTHVSLDGVYEFIARHPDPNITVDFNGENYYLNKIPEEIRARVARENGGSLDQAEGRGRDGFPSGTIQSVADLIAAKVGVDAVSLGIHLNDPQSRWLRSLVQGLVSPETTLKAVQARFQEEGQGTQFVAMLTKVAPKSAQYLSTSPAQTPLERALWRTLTASWSARGRNTPAMEAVFTGLTTALAWLVPLGAFLETAIRVFHVSSSALPVITVLLAGTAAMSLLFRKYVFLPAHGWVPSWVNPADILPIAVTKGTERLSWGLSWAYAIGTAILVHAPWAGIAIILSAIATHALYDLPKLQARPASPLNSLNPGPLQSAA